MVKEQKKANGERKQKKAGPPKRENPGFIQYKTVYSRID